MKRYTAFLLLILLLFSVPFTAQAVSTEFPADSIMREDNYIISYHSLVDQVSATRKASLGKGTNIASFTSYLVNDPGTAGLVTSQEIELMKNYSGNEPVNVTYEQAVSDINLLFRTLRACYAPYYYFGENAFLKAEKQMMEWLQGQVVVNVSELKNQLRMSLIFMKDAHSYIGYNLDNIPGVRYEYYTCNNQIFSKDEQGYYKLSNGERLRFVSFEDSNVSMKPSLLPTGEIVYSPVFFAPDNVVHDSLMYVVLPTGETRSEVLKWNNTMPYGNNDNPDFNFVSQNEIGYISLRQFEQNRYPEIFQQFVASGVAARNTKVLIFDLRSNIGGHTITMQNWVENFVGQKPLFEEGQAIRNSILNTGSSAASTYNIKYNNAGKFIQNDIPIIVLVDDLCASAGEGALCMLKTLDNVLVVGGNTGGYQLSGNCKLLHLPNSAIPCYIPTLFFLNTKDNIEYKGYEPDVWCNPIYALDYALSMIERYNLAETSSVEGMRTKLNVNIIKSQLFLQWEEYMVSPDSGFGCGSGTHLITVYKNDTPTTEFTVYSSNPNVCTCERTADGKIKLAVTGQGDSMLTVTSGNITNTFRWHAE